MGIKNSFSYKTIERALRGSTCGAYIAGGFPSHPGTCKGGGTCIQPGWYWSCQHPYKRNWENERRRGDNPEMDRYERMVAMVGCTYKLFAAIEITENPKRP
jgi:hypothetical protein